MSLPEPQQSQDDQQQLTQHQQHQCYDQIQSEHTQYQYDNSQHDQNLKGLLSKIVPSQHQSEYYPDPRVQYLDDIVGLKIKDGEKPIGMINQTYWLSILNVVPHHKEHNFITAQLENIRDCNIQQVDLSDVFLQSHGDIVGGRLQSTEYAFSLFLDFPFVQLISSPQASSDKTAPTVTVIPKPLTHTDQNRVIMFICLCCVNYSLSTWTKAFSYLAQQINRTQHMNQQSIDKINLTQHIDEIKRRLLYRNVFCNKNVNVLNVHFLLQHSPDLVDEIKQQLNQTLEEYTLFFHDFNGSNGSLKFLRVPIAPFPTLEIMYILDQHHDISATLHPLFNPTIQASLKSFLHEQRSKPTGDKHKNVVHDVAHTLIQAIQLLFTKYHFNTKIIQWFFELFPNGLEQILISLLDMVPSIKCLDYIPIIQSIRKKYYPHSTDPLLSSPSSSPSSMATVIQTEITSNIGTITPTTFNYLLQNYPTVYNNLERVFNQSISSPFLKRGENFLLAKWIDHAIVYGNIDLVKFLVNDVGLTLSLDQNIIRFIMRYIRPQNDVKYDDQTKLTLPMQSFGGNFDYDCGVDHVQNQNKSDDNNHNHKNNNDSNTNTTTTNTDNHAIPSSQTRWEIVKRLAKTAPQCCYQHQHCADEEQQSRNQQQTHGNQQWHYNLHNKYRHHILFDFYIDTLEHTYNNRGKAIKTPHHYNHHQQSSQHILPIQSNERFKLNRSTLPQLPSPPLDVQKENEPFCTFFENCLNQTLNKHGMMLVPQYRWIKGNSLLPLQDTVTPVMFVRKMIIYGANPLQINQTFDNYTYHPISFYTEHRSNFVGFDRTQNELVLFEICEGLCDLLLNNIEYDWMKTHVVNFGRKPMDLPPRRRKREEHND